MKTEAKEEATKVNGLTTLDSLPNLHEKKVSSLEFSNVYWTPQKEGEYKVGIIVDIRMQTFPDANDATKDKDLLCIMMIAQNEDLSVTQISNGSKKLVSVIQECIENGSIVVEKTPIKITYLGKKKNKTNAYNSDNWSVKPIVL
jgi:hypothetical protein